MMMMLLFSGACVHAVPPRRLGDSMREVGTRFERIGRAVLAQRWELASYDADELAEIDLSWSHHQSVATLGDAFRTRVLPALEGAVRRHDAERAFADTARACNECHIAAGMKFLEISTKLGASVPVIDR